MSEALLEARGIHRSFGRVQALSDVDLRLDAGSIHGVVGPNGAGKTSLLNVISGYLLPDSGTVTVNGRDVTRWTPARRVPVGVVRTFQNIRLFGALTARQNILLGQHSRARSGWASLLPVRTMRDRHFQAEVDELLEMFELTPYRDRRAADLPYGVQKQLDMARAMAARPSVLLLDEPAAGMTTAGRLLLSERIRQIRDEGVSVVVVEHDMDVISRVCDTVTVLNYGRLLTAGPPRTVLASPEVKVAYLGD